MRLASKAKSFFARFKRDEDGSMALMWGVSLTAVVFAVGASYDYAKVHTAKQNSQAAADMLALNAAIYVRDNGEAPKKNKDGFKNGKKYYLEDIGITLDPYSDRQATQRGRKGRKADREAPYFKVHYDTPEEGLVTVEIHAQTRPAFMGMAGIDNIDFSARSVVSYEVSDVKSPASIGLVLDVSGSMGWDDLSGTGTSRINRLKTTVKSFMGQMSSIVEGSLDDGETVALNNDIIRTGMTTYNSGVVSTTPMSYTLLSDALIDTLVASGGTNSSGATSAMKGWMQGEDAKHKQNGYENAQKFVVFMTDGVNNATHSKNCRDADGQWVYYNWWTGEISQTYKNGWYRVYQLAHNERSLHWEAPEFCEESSTYDDNTIRTCNQMKDNGVTVYTIGFALTVDEGTDQWRRAEVERANAMLSACASDNEKFFTAENGEALDEIFENIGEEIIEDTIRIRQ